VVSLLKLQEREELDISPFHTPKKSLGASGASSLSTPPYRPLYTPVQLQNQRPPRVRRLLNAGGGGGQSGGPQADRRSGGRNAGAHRPATGAGHQGGHGYGGHSGHGALTGPGRSHLNQRRIISRSATRSATRSSSAGGNVVMSALPCQV